MKFIKDHNVLSHSFSAAFDIWFILYIKTFIFKYNKIILFPSCFSFLLLFVLSHCWQTSRPFFAQWLGDHMVLRKIFRAFHMQTCPPVHWTIFQDPNLPFLFVSSPLPINNTIFLMFLHIWTLYTVLVPGIASLYLYCLSIHFSLYLHIRIRWENFRRILMS